MSEEAILQKFSPRPTFLGEGIESRVFDIGNGKILRIYKDASKQKHSERQLLSKRLSKHKLPFDLPLLHTAHRVNGTVYTIEKKFQGTDFSNVLPSLKASARKEALSNYIQAAGVFKKVVFEDLPYGELLSERLETGPDWVEYLKRRVQQQITKSKWVQQDVKQFDEVLAKINRRLEALPHKPTKNLVHGDFYPANVFIDKDLHITAVGDFSGLTVIGDYKMDTAGAVYFPEIFHQFSEDDKQYVLSLVSDLYGEDSLEIIYTYKLYYAALFADGKEYNPETYDWAVTVLNQIKP